MRRINNMNTLQLQKFSTFLCKNNYKVHTIELYSKSLIEFKPTPQDSISQLYKEILEFEKRNKANLSKALFNNLRAIKVKIRLPKLLQISGYTLYQFR